jgi:hypothetical protein
MSDEPGDEGQEGAEKPAATEKRGVVAVTMPDGPKPVQTTDSESDPPESDPPESDPPELPSVPLPSGPGTHAA